MNNIDRVKEYALGNIWANPHADRQILIKTTRLSPVNGNVNYLRLSFLSIKLPDLTTRFMVFELGGVDPNTIGLDTKMLGWMPISNIINDAQVLIMGICSGRQAVLNNGYISVLNNGNVVIALDYIKNILSFANNSTLHIRLYSNEFYNQPQNIDKRIKYLGFTKGINGTISDYALMIDQMLTASNNGYIYMCYLNGVFLPDGLPIYHTLNIGDSVECITDPMLESAGIYTLNNLDAFTSTQDLFRKIMVSTNDTNKTIYSDDMEIFLSGKTTTNKSVGVYFTRYDKEYLRLLTFKDLSIHSGRIDSLLLELFLNSDVGQLSDIKMRVYRRDNGRDRPTILDSNRIMDLMNLPSNIRKQAIAGINANIEIWRANNLEKSDFNLWISTEAKEIKDKSIFGVFSRFDVYNLLENIHEYNGNMVLPFITSNGGGKLITYDADGKLSPFVTISAVPNVNVPILNGNDFDIFLPGSHRSTELDLVVSANTSHNTLSPGFFDFFCYYNNGDVLTYAIPNVDYTFTTYANGYRVIWHSGVYGYERYVRSAQNIVDFTDMYSIAEINNGIDVYTGVTYVHDVGMSSLYVWMNNRYLTEGLDYFLFNGKVFIVYVSNAMTNPAEVTIVYAGLPSSDLVHTPKTEFGFIQHGKMLNNATYDLYSHRDKMFFVDGKAVSFSKIAENEQYVDKVRDNPPFVFSDGTAYAIVPKVRFTNRFELDQICNTEYAEDITDKEVSTFVGALYPQRVNNAMVVIPQRYTVISPLMNKLIHDISTGALIINEPEMTTGEVYALISSYLWRLNIDPSRHNLDPRFVEILPRWDTNVVTVSLMEYNFLQKVNDDFLNGLVSGLNHYLVIG